MESRMALDELTKILGLGSVKQLIVHEYFWIYGI
jgi:succinylarginine dihydrolase